MKTHFDVWKIFKFAIHFKFQRGKNSPDWRGLTHREEIFLKENAGVIVWDRMNTLLCDPLVEHVQCTLYKYYLFWLCTVLSMLGTKYPSFLKAEKPAAYFCKGTVSRNFWFPIFLLILTNPCWSVFTYNLDFAEIIARAKNSAVLKWHSAESLAPRSSI